MFDGCDVGGLELGFLKNYAWIADPKPFPYPPPNSREEQLKQPLDCKATHKIL
jgi:hypothetical protein